ncbi:MAG: argininosuccinate synthase [Actinobacteria bacterium]|nr:argininosuccinate synthase [Actinomycetota bacterium]MCL5446180.1 argininosuccinate synthase [Actinomycetota bacterium]
MTSKVVLAYSGGLDTSVAVAWLREQVNMEVIAVVVDVGQGGDFEAIRRRALGAGALDCVVVDARDEMANSYVVPAIAANGLYEGRYPLVSALSRPVIVKHLVAVARSVGATSVAHGCTGKGNDQVRFEVGTKSLAPDLDILAPARLWGMSREDLLRYANDRGIAVEATGTKLYSIDENLWGRAIECGVMEDPWASPPDDVYELTRQSADVPVEMVLTFEQGVPVALDGVTMPLPELIASVSRIAGSYGWGRVDMVENRRVGIKSRETYECPGALAIIMAHNDLEALVLERDLAHEKQRLEPRWAELVYDGLWFSPLKHALDAFFAETQRYVTGEVRLRLTPGNCIATGRRSPYSLYDYNLATYDPDDAFKHEYAEGFVRIWGLGVATWAGKQGDGVGAPGTASGNQGQR